MSLVRKFIYCYLQAKTTTLKDSKSRLLIAFISSWVIILISWFWAYHEANACKQDLMFDKKHKYKWLFDSATTDSLECVHPLGSEAESRYQFIYTYKNQYRYVIIENRKINNVKLNMITNEVTKLTSKNMKIEPSTNNDIGWGGNLLLQSQLCFDSSNRLKLTFNQGSTMSKKDTLNYTVYNGLFQSVLIKNEKNTNLYFFKYNKPKQTSIVFYKPKETLYIILINSFDGVTGEDNGIKLLNLG